LEQLVVQIQELLVQPSHGVVQEYLSAVEPVVQEKELLPLQIIQEET
jgi:hypothetical protein